MRTYETTILVRPGLARADLEGTIAQVRGLYETEGVQFLEFGKWDERKLAYPLKGETHALYLIGYLQADPLAITRVERRCLLNDLVLRQLIIAREGKDLDQIKLQRSKAAERKAAEAAAAAAAAAAAPVM